MENQNRYSVAFDLIVEGDADIEVVKERVYNAINDIFDVEVDSDIFTTKLD